MEKCEFSNGGKICGAEISRPGDIRAKRCEFHQRFEAWVNLGFDKDDDEDTSE